MCMTNGAAAGVHGLWRSECGRVQESHEQLRLCVLTRARGGDGSASWRLRAGHWLRRPRPTTFARLAPHDAPYRGIARRRDAAGCGARFVIAHRRVLRSRADEADSHTCWPAPAQRTSLPGPYCLTRTVFPRNCTRNPHPVVLRAFPVRTRSTFCSAPAALSSNVATPDSLTGLTSVSRPD